MGSVFLVSLIAVLGILPLYARKEVSHNLLMFLLSLSVGSLLGTVFMHFLPEIAANGGFGLSTGLVMLGGFMLFFVLEKFIHWHHRKHDEESTGHSHAYHLAPLNLIGDGIHNFIDGFVIAGSYLVAIPVGIATTIAIVLHEIPQEIADFGVLLYSGLSKKKALLFNWLSAATAFLGAILGLLLFNSIPELHDQALPFAAGTFLYIAAASLVPELHRHCNVKESIVHFFAILLGVAVMMILTLIGAH